MKKTVRNIFAGLASLTSSLVQGQSILLDESGMFSESDYAENNMHIISVAAGNTIEVIIDSDDVDTMLNATLPNGERIENDDYDGLNAGFMRTMAIDGDLQIIARPLTAGDVGNYRIVARQIPPARPISVGELVNDHLTTSEGKASHRYALSGQAGQRVQIDLKSYDFDTVLTLQKPDGIELYDDDGGEHGTNSRLLYNFEQNETVTLIVSSLSDDETGAFSITATALSSELVDSFDGELRVDDKRGYDGTLYDRHTFTAEAGESLTIELTSDDFDTVLYISKPDGSNLATQDDSHGGTNSMISFTIPESGDYSLFVTSFMDETGNYQVNIYR